MAVYSKARGQFKSPIAAALVDSTSIFPIGRAICAPLVALLLRGSRRRVRLVARGVTVLSAEGYSVYVKNSAIEERFPGGGGLAAYRKICPNKTFVTDEIISRVGFMVRSDAEAFIAQVAAFGLVPFSNGVSVDVAFTSHPIGTLVHCDWLELDQFKGRPVAWLKGTDPGNLFILDFELNAPNPLEVISGRELKESYEFLGIENSVEAYRHKTSGEIMYIGRTNDSEPQPPPKPLRRRKWWQFRK